MTIELSGQQRDALKAITTWYTSPARAPVFRVFGYAGSGKTTLARRVQSELWLDDVLFGAYTGKAASVLKSKGCVPASTLHSLIYTPSGAKEAARKAAEMRAVAASAASATQRQRYEDLAREYEARAQMPAWMLKPERESALRYADLLICDEVSMVSSRLAEDLLSFRVPILVLGDPGQLPPIEGGGAFHTDTPEVLLTEIHRQAAGSPVLSLAARAREEGWLGDDAYIPTAIRLADPGHRAVLAGYDQILCGTNRTRHAVNAAVRAARGFTGQEPSAGDRLMVITNNREAGVFNGQQWTATDVREGRDDTLSIAVIDDLGEERLFPMVPKAGFTGDKGEAEVRRSCYSGPRVAMTFSYALTVHKAQGSEWDRVLVIDDFPALAYGQRKAGATKEEIDTFRRQWLYTAITRASQEIHLARTASSR